MTKCPKCDLQWEPPCDQTACIELFCECISCRRFKLTEDEIKQIQTSAALERKAENAKELGLDYEPWEKFCDSTCVWTDHHPNCKLAQIEQPKVRTGDCLRVGVCASEGHKIQPQRKPLTDEEIEAIAKEHIAVGTRSFQEFARRIEAAHGIKGEA